MVDAILIEQAVGGNMDAFGQIYEIVYPKAVQYLRSMSGDIDTSEQVVQDTVVYFMQDNCKALKSLRDYNSFEPFFFQSVKNRYFNLYKKNRTQTGDIKEVCVDEIYDVKEDGELDSYLMADQAMTPEQYAEHEEIKEILIGMINELPDTQKEAFNLFVIGDMKQTEIAEVMGVPLNTVKSYLQYAKKKLSAKITEYEKKNDIKLHSMIPILPFLRLMYAQENISAPGLDTLIAAAEATAGASTAAAGSSAAAGAASVSAASAGASSAAAAATAAKVGTGIAAKVIIGIVAASVVGTSAVMLPQLLGNAENAPAKQEISSAVEKAAPIEAGQLSEGLIPSQTIEYDPEISKTVTATLKEKLAEFKARNIFMQDSYKQDCGNNYSISQAVFEDGSKEDIYKDDKLVGEVLTYYDRTDNGRSEEYSQGKLSPFDDEENIFGYTAESHFTAESGLTSHTEKYEHLTDNTYYYMEEDYWTEKPPKDTNVHRIEYFIANDETVSSICDSYIQRYLDRGYSQIQYRYLVPDTKCNQPSQNSLVLTEIILLNNGVPYETYDANGVLIERNPDGALENFDMNIPIDTGNTCQGEFGIFEQLVNAKHWHYLTYYKNGWGEIVSFIWTFDFYADGHFEYYCGVACSGDIRGMGEGTFSVENGNLHLKTDLGDEAAFTVLQGADRLYLSQTSESGLNFTCRNGFETVLRMGDMQQYHVDEVGRYVED